MKRQLQLVALLPLMGLILILTQAPVPLSAQEHLSTLDGMVLEENGNPLPGVLVEVINEKTGVRYQAISNENGRYVVAGINPGSVRVEVKLDGFEPRIYTGVVLNVGTRKSLNLELKLGTLSESVNVFAEVPIVEVSKSEVSSVVDRGTIENMPLLDRNFTSLTLTKPGAVSSPAGGMVTNALPRGTNEMLIDGVSNEETINNFTKANVPADAIQEFKVITNSFAAEYGNASGMLQSAITRSGTNNIVGGVSYYNRTEALGDVNYFLNHDGYEGRELSKDEYEKPEYKINRFAANFGGPIVKNKAHFFLAYEGMMSESYDLVNTPLEPNQGAFTREDNSHIVFGKINYQINTSNLLSLRVLYNPIRQPNAWGGGGIETFSTLGNFDSDVFDINLNWTLFPSNSTINEFRVLFAEAKNSYYSPNYPNSYRVERPSANYGKPVWYPQDTTDDRFEITDNFTIFADNHTIKMGFSYANLPQKAMVDLFNPGFYLFFTDAPFNAADPSTYPFLFMRTSGDPNFTLNSKMYGLFIQDSWRITRSLTLNYGLRYNGGSVEGLDIKGFDVKHFNPRIGFSWDPIGDGLTAVRGSWGTYTSNLSANAGFFGGVQNNWGQDTIYSPNYNPSNLDAWSQDNPFWTGPRENYVTNSASPFNVFWSAQKDQLLPYTSQWTFGVQRDLAKDWSANLDLVYSKGYGANRIERTNGVKPGTFDPTIPTRGQRDDMTRGDVMVVTDGGRHEYYALMLGLQKRMSDKWMLGLSYTLSSSKGDTEAENTQQAQNDADWWDRNYGYMSYDARHRISVNGVWLLPLDFQIAGIVRYNSATPWTAYAAGDTNLDGNQEGDFADAHRNERRGFDSFQLDATLSKFFRLGKFQIQLFAEAYNLTNQVNYGGIFNVVGTPMFGIPTSAADPRLLQIGAKVSFQ